MVLHGSTKMKHSYRKKITKGKSYYKKLKLRSGKGERNLRELANQEKFSQEQDPM